MNFPKSTSASHSSSHRWQWMVGSSAALSAAAPTGAMADRVQITQVDSLVSTVTPGAIKTDLTGDMVSDFSNLNSFTSSSTNNYLAGSESIFQVRYSAFARGSDKFSNNVSLGYAGHFRSIAYSTNLGGTVRSFTRTSAYAGTGAGYNHTSGSPPHEVRGFTQIVFSDPAINGGAATTGFIETKAFSDSLTEHTVQLVRLVFDDASTAAPAGAILGGTDPEFDRNALSRAAEAQAAAARAAQISQLKRKIKKLKKKAKKAKKAGNVKKAKKFKTKLKKLKKQLRAL